MSNTSTFVVDWTEETPCTAFLGEKCVASGSLREVAAAVWRHMGRKGRPSPAVLIFDDATARQLEVDFRGALRTVVSRLPKAVVPDVTGDLQVARGPGRPKLGVVGREVTLLPGHWEWLNAQPGGASVALRKLVQAARHAGAAADLRRAAQEAAYRFMVAMAGDRAGFEEATRALFAGDVAGFESQTAQWPADVRKHAQKLAGRALT